jgi:tRNA dimethylallyltransferase
MVEEVRGLLDSGIPAEDLIYYGLEYKFVTQYLMGELHYGDMVSLLNTAIHQFSKRQMTWFRRMERMGFKINWVDADLPEEEKFRQIFCIFADYHLSCV